jgi:hypothetical protein
LYRSGARGDLLGLALLPSLLLRLLILYSDRHTSHILRDDLYVHLNVSRE